MSGCQGLKGAAPKILEHQAVPIAIAVDYKGLHLLDGLFAADLQGEAEIHYGLGGESGMFDCDKDPIHADVEYVGRYQSAKPRKSWPGLAMRPNRCCILN